VLFEVPKSSPQATRMDRELSRPERFDPAPVSIRTAPMNLQPARVRLGFHLDGRGDYALSGRSRPPELFAEHFPFRSATFGQGAEVELDLDHISPTPPDPALVGRQTVHLVSIYNAKDTDEIIAFDRRITDEYTAHYAAECCHYLGVYAVHDGPLGLKLAEILVYDTANLGAAQQDAERDSPPRIAAIEDECRALQDRVGPGFVLWLAPGAGSG